MHRDLNLQVNVFTGQYILRRNVFLHRTSNILQPKFLANIRVSKGQLLQHASFMHEDLPEVFEHFTYKDTGNTRYQTKNLYMYSDNYLMTLV